mmetsp:Transcript_21900/g.49976  ORF Transcript_21900/g.49976 Transcript_21900/m.49976 type:complete len:518 (+) Transcript_21900:48-1601(+)
MPRSRKASKAIPVIPAPPTLPCGRAPSNEEIYGGPDRAKSSDEVFEHAYVKALLSHARKQVRQDADWVICVRTYGRSGIEEPGTPKKRQGGIESMTLRALEEAGLDLSSRSVYRNQVYIFVSHEDQHYMSGRYGAALGEEWQQQVVVGVKGADKQVRFIEECFHLGQHVIVCDDNIKWIQAVGQERFSWRPLNPGELMQLFTLAAGSMEEEGASLWGTNPSHNTSWLCEKPWHGTSAAEAEVKTRLGLIYGAFFGFICRHEPELYTQYGQIKDDVERTLRYWHRDRVVLRYPTYALCKSAPPGKFLSNKGGISEGSNQEKHAKEGANALLRMYEGFAMPYMKLAADRKGQNRVAADTGVDFNGNATQRYSEHPKDPRGLKLGFLCLACRSSSGAACKCVDPWRDRAQELFCEEGLAALGVCAAAASTRQRSERLLKKMYKCLTAEERRSYEVAAHLQLRTEQWSTKLRAGLADSLSCNEAPLPPSKKRKLDNDDDFFEWQGCDTLVVAESERSQSKS